MYVSFFICAFAYDTHNSTEKEMQMVYEIIKLPSFSKSAIDL